MLPTFEVAHIVRQYGDHFIANKQPIGYHKKVLNAISICRTAQLGGHVDACDKCSHTRISYNSCRNRHCPKCQSTERENGSLHARKIYCQYPTTTWYSPSPNSSTRTAYSTQRQCIISCLMPPKKPCLRLLPTKNTWAHLWDLLPYCTLGGKTYHFIHTYTALCQVAALLLLDNGKQPEVKAIFCFQ